MTCFLYAVRCNFARPDLEAEWNAWYSGAKLVEMLCKPHFLAVQRFAAVGLDQRRTYLALWCVASPDAFTSAEYRSDWGFFEWTPHIRDWSRDLYRAPVAADDPVFAIGSADALYFGAFDFMDAAAARTALTRVRAQRPGVLWLEIAGLDRHAPILGVKKLSRSEPITPLADAAGLVETVFAPITPRFVAAAAMPTN